MIKWIVKRNQLPTCIEKAKIIQTLIWKIQLIPDWFILDKLHLTMLCPSITAKRIIKAKIYIQPKKYSPPRKLQYK